MSTLQQRFDIFWDAYPKKKSKDAAERRFFQKKIDDETLAKILAALQWQKTSKDWLRDGGQYIPYPATYLNAGGWKDVPTVATAPKQPETLCAGNCGRTARATCKHDGKLWCTDVCWWNHVHRPKPATTGPTPFDPQNDPELGGDI